MKLLFLVLAALTISNSAFACNAPYRILSEREIFDGVKNADFLGRVKVKDIHYESDERKAGFIEYEVLDVLKNTTQINSNVIKAKFKITNGSCYRSPQNMHLQVGHVIYEILYFNEKDFSLSGRAIWINVNSYLNEHDGKIEVVK